MVKFNVFCKTISTKKNKDFRVFFTKNENGVSFRVNFVSDCENTNLIPKSNEPFVLVVDEKKISAGIKRVRTDDGKEFKKPTLYIRKIEAIEEYEEPEFSMKSFNSIDESVFDEDADLPF